MEPEQPPGKKARTKPPTWQSVQSSQSSASASSAVWPSLQSWQSSASVASAAGLAAEGGSDKDNDWWSSEASAAEGGSGKDNDWWCSLCHNHNWFRRGFCNGMHGRCQNPRDFDFAPGDWYCTCGNFNRKHRKRCNRSQCQLPQVRGEVPRKQYA